MPAALVTRRSRFRLTAVAVGLVLSSAAGCGGGSSNGAASNAPSGTPTASAGGGTGGTTGTPSSTAPGSSGATSGATTGGTRTVQSSVYFMDGEHLAAAHRRVTPPATAAGAIRALLTGPNATERTAGRTTAIPSGTVLRGISVHDKTATVDLSGRFDDGGGSLSMQSRLAQVVFTATQYQSIQQVSFALDGKPVKVFGGEGIVLDHPVNRTDFEDVAPAILVESPAIGDTVSSPVRVWGSANVFEGSFKLKLTDRTGRTVADSLVQATSGTGTRGTFDVRIAYRNAQAGPGRLTAYYLSAKDGSTVIVARIPLTLAP